jgi:hypothetical protein
MTAPLITAILWTAIAWTHYPAGRHALFGCDMIDHQPLVLAGVFLIGFIGAVGSVWSAQRMLRWL